MSIGCKETASFEVNQSVLATLISRTEQKAGVKESARQGWALD